MHSIKLKTKIPGPNSQRLLKEKQKYITNGISSLIPIFAKKAKGALIEDVDGNVFIDFYGGIGAVNSGHNNPHIINAIKKQSEKLEHTCFPVVHYESYLELCKTLNHITPGNFKKKSALFNSGAEAVENAIKFARAYTKREAIVSFEHGFHGRTLLTLSLTSKVKPYKFGFGPFAPETYKLPYPYVYRKPNSFISEDEYINYLLNDIETEFFKGVVAAENIAAFVIELVTGEGGFIVAPKKYIQGLAKICKKHGILLIIDEIQTGFARTGKMFATEHYGINPDLITMAKSMSNGMPISAVTGKKEIMDSVDAGSIGGTFIGNPICCEASLATIDFMKKHNLPKKAAEIGKLVMEHFNHFKQKYEIVGDSRGLGAMCAIEIVKNKKNKEPDKDATNNIIKNCYENGLLMLSSGILGNDIRTLMPLVIPEEQLKEGLDIIEYSLFKQNKN